MLRVFAPQALFYARVGRPLRTAAVLPPVRRAFNRPRDCEPGAHRLLRGLCALEQRASTGAASRHGGARTGGGDHAGHCRPCRGGHTTDVAAAPSAPAGATVPDGVARRAGGLALVGVVELIAIDVANVVAIALANGRGTTGAIVLFNYSSQVFNSIAAILALSIVVSAFPVMSARDGPAFERTSAGSTRAVVLMSALGTAVIAAIAVPAAHLLAKQPDQVPQLIEAFALFAPGVAGLAVIAIFSRMMFVIGRLKVAAAGLAGSWLVVIVADLVLVQLVQPRQVVAALALGTTIGQTVVAIPMVFVARRICGTTALQGVGHAALAGVAACVAAATVGVGVSLAVPIHHKLVAFALAIPAAGCAIVVFGIVAYLLDDGDFRSVLASVRRVGMGHGGVAPAQHSQAGQDSSR